MASDTPTGPHDPEPAPEQAGDASRDGGARFTARPLLMPDEAPADVPPPTALDRAWGVATPIASEAAFDDAFAADAPPDPLPGAHADPLAVADVAGLAAVDDTEPEHADDRADAEAQPLAEDPDAESASWTEADATDPDAPAETPPPEAEAEAHDETEPPAEAAHADLTSWTDAQADDGDPSAETPPEADADLATDVHDETAPPTDADAPAGPPSDDMPISADTEVQDAPATPPVQGDEAVAEDAADAVNEAFDQATAPAKSDRPAPVTRVEGTLDVTPLGPEDFDADDLKTVLRTMLTSRRLDEKMLTLLKQGKGFFHIGSSGHEAAQIALGRELRGGHDAFCFYYRDLGTALALGLTPEEVLQAHFGKADDPFGGGRQMPEHFGHKRPQHPDARRRRSARSTCRPSASRSRTAATAPRAASTAWPTATASWSTPRAARAPPARAPSTRRSTGPRASACRCSSTSRTTATPSRCRSSSRPPAAPSGPSSRGYDGLERAPLRRDRLLPAASAARAAVAHARAGRGPVALHADVVRLLPHSSSDDHGKYREGEVLEAERARDPLPRLIARLVEAGVVTADEVEAMRADVHREIDELARAVEAQADPDPATATRHVYYEGPDEREYETEGPAGELIVMVDAINHALDEELARDERVLVYGEDVGGGKGGVFTATRGLAAKHGARPLLQQPARRAIPSSAARSASPRPATSRSSRSSSPTTSGPACSRSATRSPACATAPTARGRNPMVIRMPCGGYIHGGLCHSQNVEAMFSHWPGLQVVMPSNAADAKGLLKSAIRGNDPVIFLEHKSLYRQGPARRPEPHADYLVPIGKAAVTREGTDLTIVTWGAIVYSSLAAARALEKEGVSVEIVDIRSMYPLDTETILASARKTGRVLVAYEDHEFMGFGAEIAAQVQMAAFHDLDAPVHRVAGAFSSIPYADPLEEVVLPQDADVLSAARAVLAY